MFMYVVVSREQLKLSFPAYAKTSKKAKIMHESNVFFFSPWVHPDRNDLPYCICCSQAMGARQGLA